MASSVRAASARRAVRRASRIAVPVMGVGFLGVWAEATLSAGRAGGVESFVVGAGAALVSLFLLGLWLGCAALAGWSQAAPTGGAGADE